MADAWLPTAARMPAQLDGGFLKGGAPRAVWFTSETDPRAVSTRSIARALLGERHPVHLVWNPVDGELLQMIPVTRAALLLDPEIGREGRICIQIMVAGRTGEPFTSSPLNGLAPLLAWLDAWGVARRWPAGPPLPAPQPVPMPVPQSIQAASHDSRQWSRGGHFGGSQVPGATRPDPGGIDIWKITGPQTPVAEIPHPRFASERQVGVALQAASHSDQQPGHHPPPRRSPRPLEPVVPAAHEPLSVQSLPLHEPAGEPVRRAARIRS